jgi:Flp pilus assembly protein TadG
MMPKAGTNRRTPRYDRGSGMGCLAISSRPRKRSLGQAMTEFAIVAPILFFLLFGIFESGLLLFVVGTARWGTAEVARQESESGNAANADSVSIAVLRRSAIGTTTLGQVNEIDIYHLTEQLNGSLTVDAAHYNKYDINGNPLAAITWPSPTRNVRNGQSDFLGITLKYQYNWKTGVFLANSPLQLTQLYEIRLEPQTY